MKEKIILSIALSIALMILVLSPMIVHAACEVGEGTAKWTLYSSERVTELVGKICPFSGDVWQAMDKDKNTVFFAGAFVLKGGHHGGSRILKEKLKENNKVRPW